MKGGQGNLTSFNQKGLDKQPYICYNDKNIGESALSQGFVQQLIDILLKLDK